MEAILRSLQSNNNAERDAAERQFNQALASDVRSTMNNLLQLVLVSPDAALCQFGAVLFRGQLLRKKTGEKWWKTLSQAEQQNLRDVLLQRLQSAPTPKTKRQVSQIVAQVARMSYDKQGNDTWPGLLAGLAQMCTVSGDNGATANVAVMTVEEIMKTVPAKAETDETPFQLRDLLVKMMVSPPDNSAAVRVAAVSGAACLLAFVDEADGEHFQSVIPAALNVVTQIGGSEELLLKWCESVIEVIHNQPRLVHKSNVAEQLVQTMLELGGAAANNGSEDVQKQSVEVCLQVAVELPLAIKGNEGLINGLLEACIRLTLHADEDEDEDDFSKVEGAADEDTLYDHGFRALYILIEHLGEDLTVPKLFPMIHQLLAQTGDWRRERAGISALNSLAYTSGKLLYESLQSVLERLVPFVNNPSTKMRVRHVALDTLSTLLFVYSDVSSLYEDDEDSDETGFDNATERDNIQKLFGPMLLDTIVKTLEAPQSRSPAQWAFASKGALAVAYYCSGAEDGKGADLLKNAAQPVLERLYHLVEATSSLQQAQTQQHGFVYFDGAVDVADVMGSCLQAIGAIAKSLGEDFIPFYDTFMPLVKKVYAMQEQAVSEAKAQMAAHQNVGKMSTERTTWNEKQNHLLGLAMECMSFMGMAVGAAKFMPDAGNLMEFVIRYMDTEWSKGDSDRNGQVASLATNICVCMGESVDEHILGKVVPRLIEWARVPHYYTPDDAELDKLQEEDDEDEEAEDTQGKQYVMTEEGILCINTYQVKEKQKVIELIQTLIADLGTKLMPWLGDLAGLLIELLNGDVTAPDIQLYAIYGLGGLIGSMSKWLQQPSIQVNEQRREFAQTVFQNALSCCVNSLVDGFIEAEGEDEERENDEEMGKEMDEDEDQSSLLLTTTANQITEILRAAFESGGLTDSNIDRMCADDYTRERFPPVFNVHAEMIPETIETLVSLMKRSCERPRGKPWWKDSHNHEVMDALAESVGLLVKSHGEAALQAFAEHVLPVAHSLLDAPLSKESNGVTPSLKAVGLFFLDDVIEYGGPRAAELVNKAVPYLLQHSDAANNGLRQASLFGLGVCVQHGGNFVDQYMDKIVNALVAAIEAPNSRTGFGASATDNAISALLKCIIFKNASSIISKFLTYPPCKSDALESRIVHYRLYRTLATQNANFMPHADRIRQILLEACTADNGRDEKTGVYDEDASIVSNETRAWVHANLGGPAPVQPPVPPS